MSSERLPGSGGVIPIGDRLFIPETELSFTASRSSGPGGQNINKVSTRVALVFDVSRSKTLSEEEKRKIRERLPNRVSKQGVLRVVCQRHRSQAKNREGAIERFVQLVESALEERAPRVKTKVSGAAKRRRLEQKARRSRIKRLRSTPATLDE